MNNTILERWVSFDQVAHPYLEPIQTLAQHQAALSLLETVWAKVGENSGSPYAGLLELLLERIQTFEDSQDPIPDAPAHQVLGFLLRQHSLTQGEVATAVGMRQSNLSAVLKQKRQLTVAQIKALAKYFGISPTCLL
jgi:HTH-type transcriptional regulator / antitoxin HigA